VYLNGQTEIEDIYWRVDHMMNDCFDKLDDYQISNIIRSFSKGL